MTEITTPAKDDQTWLAESRWIATCHALFHEGQIIAEDLERFERNLPAQIGMLSYLATHLAVHSSMSVARYAIPIPMPGIGGLMRLCWTVTHRLTLTLKRQNTKARVHSLPVMAIAIIPFGGIFAYLYEVKRLDPKLAYIACEHVCRQHKKQSLRQLMQKWPKPVRRLLSKHYHLD